MRKSAVMTSAVCALALGLALAACAGREGDGGDGNEGDGNEGEGGLAASDPAVLATFEPWEADCIRWLRAGCLKSDACDLPLSTDCDDDDEELRFACNDMVEGDDETPCAAPDPQSFVDCQARTEAETCQEYCDSEFCFDFCFFSCLD